MFVLFGPLHKMSPEACGTHGSPDAFVNDGSLEACGTHGPSEVFWIDGPPKACDTHDSLEAKCGHGAF